MTGHSSARYGCQSGNTKIEYHVGNAKYVTNCIQASICWLLSMTDSYILKKSTFDVIIQYHQNYQDSVCVSTYIYFLYCVAWMSGYPMWFGTNVVTYM